MMKRIESALRAILGAKCSACKKPLPIGQRAVLCEGCFVAWEAEKRAPCQRCHLPHAHCRCTPTVLEAVDCAFHLAQYEKHTNSVCRTMILRAKQKLDSTLCDFLAQELGRLLPRSLPKETVCVTYVPRAQTAVKDYGYDQAKRITKALATEKGFAFCDALRHCKAEGTAQKEQDLQGRLENVKQRYEAGGGISQVRAKTVLLVDDVMTSGATLNACAAVLKENGADRVWTLTVGAVPKSKRTYSSNYK